MQLMASSHAVHLPPISPSNRAYHGFCVQHTANAMQRRDTETFDQGERYRPSSNEQSGWLKELDADSMRHLVRLSREEGKDSERGGEQRQPHMSSTDRREDETNTGKVPQPGAPLPRASSPASAERVSAGPRSLSSNLAQRLPIDPPEERGYQHSVQRVSSLPSPRHDRYDARSPHFTVYHTDSFRSSAPPIPRDMSLQNLPREQLPAQYAQMLSSIPRDLMPGPPERRLHPPPGLPPPIPSQVHMALPPGSFPRDAASSRQHPPHLNVSSSSSLPSLAHAAWQSPPPLTPSVFAARRAASRSRARTKSGKFMSSNPGRAVSQETMKERHRVTEQKRRSRMQGAYRELRDLLLRVAPNIDLPTSSQADLLWSARWLLTKQKERLRDLMDREAVLENACMIFSEQHE